MRPRIALPILPILLATVACGGKKSDDKPSAAKPAPAAPTPAPAPTPTPPPPPAAPAIDPATFVAVDVKAVAAIADAVVMAPPGAKVEPDQPSFGDQQVKGAVIAAGDFRLHVWHSTIGGERTAAEMTAKITDAKAVYTELNHEVTTVDYAVESGGQKRFGYFQALDGWDELKLGDQVLCGPERTVASADALAPYRAACGMIKRAK